MAVAMGRNGTRASTHLRVRVGAGRAAGCWPCHARTTGQSRLRHRRGRLRGRRTTGGVGHRGAAAYFFCGNSHLRGGRSGGCSARGCSGGGCGAGGCSGGVRRRHLRGRGRGECVCAYARPCDAMRIRDVCAYARRCRAYQCVRCHAYERRVCVCEAMRVRCRCPWCKWACAMGMSACKDLRVGAPVHGRAHIVSVHAVPQVLAQSNVVADLVALALAVLRLRVGGNDAYARAMPCLSMPCDAVLINACDAILMRANAVRCDSYQCVRCHAYESECAYARPCDAILMRANAVRCHSYESECRAMPFLSMCAMPCL
jgi:hypothetical protein